MSTASQMHSEYLELDLQQSEDPGLINLHQQTQCQSPLPYTDNSLYDAAESPENSTVLPELLDSARAAVLNTDDSDSTHQKTKTLLDRLARENFDLVSDKLVRWINKNHIDVCIIGRFTRLVVEKAKDRPSESEVYARLCKKIMDHISPDFGDKGLRSPRGNPLTSAQIFRKYLLDHCQEDFEQTQGPASPHAKDSDNVKTITEVSSHIRGNRNSRPQEGENPLLVEEPKHRQLGLFRFLGELFKLQMLTERIMHECVKRLLTDMGHPDEATIVCLCELLTSIGKALENPRERARMDTHFSRMKHLQTSPHVSQCAKSLLSKVIELRECGWIPKNCYGVQNTTSTQRHNGVSHFSFRC
jgi:translation initiation factor 4G